MSLKEDLHIAGPQMAGYLYQIQAALILLFDLEEGYKIGIEIQDDVHTEVNGQIKTYQQYKYKSRGSASSLTDKSEDFWKTLSIWATKVAEGTLDLESTQNLILITRATPVKNSNVALLTTDKRSDMEAENIAKNLLSIPTGKGKTAKYYASVQKLTLEALTDIVKKVLILGSQPSLTDSFKRLSRKIRYLGIKEEHNEIAVQIVSGWLWKRVLLGLESKEGVIISEEEFYKAKGELQNILHGNKLIPRYSHINVEAAELLNQQNRNYIRQLELIQADQEVMIQAMTDYFRASGEFTTWIERGEMLPIEWDNFERELIDHWKKDRLYLNLKKSKLTDENDVVQACLEHYFNIMKLNIQVRPEWIHSYLTSGSYQALAERVEIGWHLRYEEMLNGLNSGSETQD